MKNLNTKWTVIKKGSKFHLRMSNDRVMPYWPWDSPSEFDTLEEAMDALKKQKAEFESAARENEETVVFVL